MFCLVECVKYIYKCMNATKTDKMQKVMVRVVVAGKLDIMWYTLGFEAVQ